MGLDMRFLGGNRKEKAKPEAKATVNPRPGMTTFGDENKKNNSNGQQQRRNTGILRLRGSRSTVSHVAQDDDSEWGGASRLVVFALSVGEGVVAFAGLDLLA